MSQKTVSIYGKEYTLQKITPREWSRLKERCRNRNGHMVEERFITEILEHIVVDPKVNFDDFEEVAEVEELIGEAVSFQQGKRGE